MEYLTGYTIKPHAVTGLGEVRFTDGTNTNLGANQVTCEAYGYTYDQTSGTCRSYRFNTNLNRNISNINNRNNGSGNTNELGANTIQVNGTNNTTKGFNNNCFINGATNEIANGVDNATVLGVGGKASSNGEFTIGGGLPAGLSEEPDTYSDRKMSVVNLTGVTEDNTATKLSVNGGSSYINVELNSIVGFEIYITRFETGGGSSGTAGNYSYRNIKGVVQIDNAGAMAFIVGYNRNIGKIGVWGTAAMIDAGVSTTSPSITIQVSDRNNVTNIWSATVTLHQLTSNITF
jgi:hypothetical protein|tara:strand:- start:2390 stop:3259 length:870 start_codon:yes stop_codon:yes gene_type:complete